MSKKVGFAFSGGGIKAYAQIGMLKQLEQHGITPHAVSGTSMGSLIATLLALGFTTSQIEKAMLEIESEIIQKKLLTANSAQIFPILTQSATGLLNPAKFVEVLKKLLGTNQSNLIKDCSFPLFIHAVDIITGKIVLFTNQPIQQPNDMIVIHDATLLEAIQASCSFPMVFETMNWREYQLVDGGVMINTPVSTLKKAGYNLVVSLSMNARESENGLIKMRDLANRVIELIINQLDTQQNVQATLNLNAYDHSIGIFSFGKGCDAIKLGEQVALEATIQLSKFKKQTKSFWY